MATTELVHHALDELKLLVRAEVLHAKQELHQELARTKLVAILLGAGVGVALCGLSVLFVALAVGLPLPEDWAMLIVGVALLVAAVVCAGLGYRKLPRKPMSKTRKRIQEDVAMVRSGWHA
jgi:peptidoglycan/LPS O-acetylase OafA/YrhL